MKMNKQVDVEEDSRSRSPLIVSDHNRNTNSEINLLLDNYDGDSGGMLSRLNLELNEIEKKLRDDIYIDENGEEKQANHANTAVKKGEAMKKDPRPSLAKPRANVTSNKIKRRSKIPEKDIDVGSGLFDDQKFIKMEK
jgi:hypothetical protein